VANEPINFIDTSGKLLALLPYAPPVLSDLGKLALATAALGLANGGEALLDRMFNEGSNSDEDSSSTDNDKGFTPDELALVDLAKEAKKRYI